MMRDVLTTVMELVTQNVFSVPKPLKVFGVSEIEDAFRLF